MILPTVIGVAESSIRAVPDSYYEGALGSWRPHGTNVFFAVLREQSQEFLPVWFW